MMKLGKLEIDLKELTNFIVKAKKNGYAGSDEKIREEDNSKTYVFQEGNFHYTDNYAGSCQAPGTEIVRWQRPNGQRIWQMSYSGGMLPEFWDNEKLTKATFKFLKKALMKVKSNSEYPFRGPSPYENKNFKYNIHENGFDEDWSIKRFSCWETIVNKEMDRTVFLQHFIGGLVVPKIVK